ncbi:MAG: porin family protein [Bacteroidales bacterium]
MKKLISLALLLLSAVTLQSQQYKPMNQPYVDQRWYNFGFLVGLHTQDLSFTHAPVINGDADAIYVEQPGFSPGFSVGLLTNLRISDHFSFRISPTIHFGSKNVEFIDRQTSLVVETQDIRSTYLMVPFNVKYAGRRLNNVRPYLVTGLSMGFDLTRKKDQELLLKPMNTFLEFGAGFEFYFQYFKLIPEFKFCLGLSNVLEKSRPDLTNSDYERYTRGLDKIEARMLVFTLYFE